MAEVKWIKITVDMFDDEKIKIIQSMPEGDSLLVVWIRLITLAGKTNDGGYIYISENMPYTDEMLSVIINKPLNIIRLALDTFDKLGMIENDIKGIYLTNFEKYQSLDKMERIKEQNRLRKQRQREREKQLKLSGNVTSHGTVTQSHATDIDIDIDNNIYIAPSNEGKPKKEVKKSYGEYGRIKLTEKQYNKLCEDFNKDFIDKQIKLLDEYVQGNDNKNGYKDFNLVLRKSIRENWFKPIEEKKPTKTERRVF